jgi:hypothetical protein
VILSTIGASLLAVGLFRVPCWHIGRVLAVAAAAGCGWYSYRKLRAARVRKEYVNLHREQVRERADRAARLHQRAVEILAECQEKNSAFALSLRNFDVEAFEWILPALKGLIQRVRFHHGDRGVVETQIAAALAGRLPIVGIANAVLLQPDDQDFIPKLELPGDRWRETLVPMN